MTKRISFGLLVNLGHEWRVNHYSKIDCSRYDEAGEEGYGDVDRLERPLILAFKGTDEMDGETGEELPRALRFLLLRLRKPMIKRQKLKGITG